MGINLTSFRRLGCQRISLIDLKDVARRPPPRRNGSMSVRTYARKYRYPKYGFGQIHHLWASGWAEGVELKTGATITRLSRPMAASNGCIGNKMTLNRASALIR